MHFLTLKSNLSFIICLKVSYEKFDDEIKSYDTKKLTSESLKILK